MNYILKYDMISWGTKVPDVRRRAERSPACQCHKLPGLRVTCGTESGRAAGAQTAAGATAAES